MTEPFNSGIDWLAVDAVIFDVDGTLFDHTALRGPMLASMLARLITRRMRWRDLQTLRIFRRERERLALAETGNIGTLQYDRPAAAARRPRHEVEAVIAQWMVREPLAFVPRYGFPDAARFITQLHKRAVSTGVFSDYPAHAKLHALGISVGVVRDATEPDVGWLKPRPDGFIRVAELLRVSPGRCLIIGDRDDRDGEAARRGGFMFLRKVAAFGRTRTRAFTHYGGLIAEVEHSR